MADSDKGVDPGLFESDLGLDDEEASTESAETEASAAPEQSGEVPPLEESAPEEQEEDLSEVTYSYVVQKGFSEEGSTFHPGDVIPVKCKYCALWNREWLGKVRCSPGRLFEDVPMSADRFSCETFFICKEMDAELVAFLNMSLPEIQTIKRLIPGTKRMLDVASWLDTWATKHEVKKPLPEVWRNAKGFITAFDSLEQIEYVAKFISSYCSALTKREKERRPRKPTYEAGDWVDFTDLKSGETVSAIILSMGRGLIRLAGIKAQSGQKYEFKLKEWKKTRSPKIIRKTAAPTSA